MSNSSCKRMQGHSQIAIRNNSPNSIIVFKELNVDTVNCLSFNNSFINNYFAMLKPAELKSDFLVTYNEGWESRFSYEKWYIYFINKDTFNNIPCDTFKKYKYYKKIDVTLDYLNQNNWTITYP